MKQELKQVPSTEDDTATGINHFIGPNTRSPNVFLKLLKILVSKKLKMKKLTNPTAVELIISSADITVKYEIFVNIYNDVTTTIAKVIDFARLFSGF